MNIQWFPGHMTKAIRMMEENLRLVDALIYVIDSRAVFSCNNPLFDKLIAGKKVLYVFNKCGLVREGDLSRWCASFDEQGKTYVNSSPARWETTIPAGEVFYMGDNRAVSADSRSSFGTCKEEQIVGVVPRWAMSGAVKWFTGLRADISARIANLFR